MSVLKQGLLHAILSATVLGTTVPSLAQTVLTPPSPVTQGQPDTARNIVGIPVEGWAIVRYSVLQDGRTSHVRVVESVPPSLDIDGIAEAAQGWTFQAATSDGAAIDWHNGESIVAFGATDSTVTEPSPEFLSAYDAIVGMIDTDRFTEALEASSALLNEQATSRIELGLAMAQLASINILGDNPHRALRYLRLATDRRVPSLPLQDLFPALQLKLRVETELGRWREALITYDWIAAGLDPDAPNPFIDVANMLQGQWDNAEFLEISAFIGDTPWRYDIGRRYFYVDKVNGAIDSIDVECDTRRLTIDFQADADYQLPEAFGDCTLFVNGTPGTSFSYIGVLPKAE
jgi:hypothetical protein